MPKSYSHREKAFGKLGKHSLVSIETFVSGHTPSCVDNPNYLAGSQGGHITLSERLAAGVINYFLNENVFLMQQIFNLANVGLIHFVELPVFIFTIKIHMCMPMENS